ncbi:MAG: tRNA (adenosine(37)-N6)-dimethylallyltransferase MiaA [Candidatus Cloacimonadales bacterium]|nr:tRNA (adenosine(37)-N6)-dimethylallyltransferase MiaA [Candidatus Cloacimonadales bacterium]
MIPVIILQGPTAVGKSSVALEIARHFQTEIISADSRQVYKFMAIGTAKPSQPEQKKIKHHLIDIITPDQVYSAGDFEKDAAKIIKQLHSENKIPLVVGGTGFYVKALMEGIFQSPNVPQEIREKLKEQAAEKGSEFLHQKLQQIDPDSAIRANPNDLNRIIRALEVYEFTGKTITQLWQENPAEKKNFRFLNLLLTDEREKIYSRINQRVDEMMAAGLLDEAANLLQKGFAKTSPGLNTVGYKELIPYFENGVSLDVCSDAIKQHTRNYAKRQMTWYRKVVFDLTIAASGISFYAINKVIDEFLEEE